MKKALLCLLVMLCCGVCFAEDYKIEKATDGIVMCPVCDSTDTVKTINGFGEEQNLAIWGSGYDNLGYKYGQNVNICDNCGNVYFPTKLKLYQWMYVIPITGGLKDMTEAGWKWISLERR